MQLETGERHIKEAMGGPHLDVIYFARRKMDAYLPNYVRRAFLDVPVGNAALQNVLTRLRTQGSGTHTPYN